ncbi:MAG: SIS domain-containing protein [Thermoguttaceae bacterium]|jgi:D-sedoheptulose 7-phosphate isomerase
MLGTSLDFTAYLDRLEAELRRVDPKEVQRLADLLYQVWKDGRWVFIFGNGGSACSASHLCEDLGKGTLREADLRDESKRRLRVMSLTDNVGWLTAVGNDCGYDQIFVQQLMNFGQTGDLAVAISGSGNSPNVLAAVDWANRHGLVTFGMTGFDGGKLRQVQQAGIHVPLGDMGMVEAIHGCVIHWIIDDLHGRINGCGRYGST